MARAIPSPPSAGAAKWVASAVVPQRMISRWILASRSVGCSRLSKMRMPAPSLMASPSRVASKGRQAVSGSSLSVDKTP